MRKLLFALFLCIGMAQVASAERVLPSNGQYGKKVRLLAWPSIEIDGITYQVTQGKIVHSADDRLLMPMDLNPHEQPVLFVTNEYGYITEIWVLTHAEEARLGSHAK